MATQFALSQSELDQKTAQGRHTVFGINVSWAFSNLNEAGLIKEKDENSYVVTEVGLKALEAPSQIDWRILLQRGRQPKGEPRPPKPRRPREGKVVIENDADHPPPSSPYVERALEKLFMERSVLESILAALRRKKNVVLQGPPGVGKTFAAREIAFSLLGESDPKRIAMVQFHQSYAYEDFVQGWRPKPEGGFRLKNGVFIEFCKRARSDPDREYVFIIDEINRGNLSKIFGELMMLIEADKRGAENAIPLTYFEGDGETFSVPTNVYLLGLMNTADRSLALVDYALRRRFVFFSLKPAFASRKFAEQITKAGGTEELVEAIQRGIETLNKRIMDDAELGEGFLIGHSFFCPGPADSGIGSQWFRDIVDGEIAALIREYWFDKKKTDVDVIIHELLSSVKPESTT